MSESLRMPRRRHTERGDERRVGIEIEFAGLSPDDIAGCVTACFGGQVQRLSRYERLIDTEQFGRFRVELDFRYLTALAREQQRDKKCSDLERLATELLGDLAENFVPYELVTPPFALSALPRMESVITALRDAGAEGTGDALHYAFGVHFNPELPALDASTIVTYFKAFLCLYDWLSASESPALTRRLSPFIRPFPDEYCALVVDPNYWPELDRFSDDYLAHNPTRNRALDLLPLLAELDEARVRAAVGAGEKINKRPTLHYRLPNSDIGDPAWGLKDAWEDWLQVESLADDRKRLDAVSKAYHAHLQRALPDWLSPWKEQVKAWLDVH